ncbi:hypothetical protein ACJ5H2_21425 [Nocardioides sp. R1-1]
MKKRKRPRYGSPARQAETEQVVDAWRMVVPQKLARGYDLTHPECPGGGR